MSKLKLFYKQHNGLISFLLIISLILSSSAFAFISVHKEQQNTFTLGDITIELYEDNWYDHDTQAINIDEDENSIYDRAEFIAPGQIVSQSPYVENTSMNPAWIFVSVGVPTVELANAIKTESQFAALKGSQLKLKVTAYGLQQGIVTDNNLADMWHVYSNSDTVLSSIRTGNTSVETLKILDPDTTQNWEYIETIRATDTYDYYIYGYKNILHGKDEPGITQPEGQERPYYRTPQLFSQVTVCGYATKSYIADGTGSIWNNEYIDNASKCPYFIESTDVEQNGSTVKQFKDIPLSQGVYLHFELSSTNYLLAFIYFDKNNNGKIDKDIDDYIFTTDRQYETRTYDGTNKWSAYPFATMQTKSLKCSKILEGTSSSGGGSVPAALLVIPAAAYGTLRVIWFGFNQIHVGGQTMALSATWNSSGKMTVKAGGQSIYTASVNYANKEWIEMCISTGTIVGNVWWQ